MINPYKERLDLLSKYKVEDLLNPVIAEKVTTRLEAIDDYSRENQLA
jgi:hypothetical protein